MDVLDDVLLMDLALSRAAPDKARDVRQRPDYALVFDMVARLGTRDTRRLLANCEQLQDIVASLHERLARLCDQAV